MEEDEEEEKKEPVYRTARGARGSIAAMNSGVMAGRRELTEGLNIQLNDFILPQKRGTSQKLELCSGRSNKGMIFKSEKIKLDDH